MPRLIGAYLIWTNNTYYYPRSLACGGKEGRLFKPTGAWCHLMWNGMQGTLVKYLSQIRLDKGFLNGTPEALISRSRWSTLFMVYKGSLIWKTRGIPYYFQNFDSFCPRFAPQKITSLVYFLPYLPQD